MIIRKFFTAVGIYFFTLNSLFADGYEIKATLNGVKDSMIYLANYYGDKQYLADSTKADSRGNIIFKGEKALDGGIYLVIYPEKKYFELIMDREQKFSFVTDITDPVKSMKISNSKDNELFYDYLKFILKKSEEAEILKKNLQDSTSTNKEAAKEKLKLVDKEVKDYKERYINDYPSTLLAKVFAASEEPEVPEAPLLDNGAKDSVFAFYYYRNHYFDGVDLNDERLIRTPIFHNKIQTFFKNLVPQIPDSLIKAADSLIDKIKSKELFKYTVHYLTYTAETSNIMGMDAVFVHMVKKYYHPGRAYWLDPDQLYKISERAKILDPLLIGKPVPPLVLKDEKGISHSIYNVKSNYTVLYFWDPDCSHCKVETPKLKAWYDSVKTKGVEVFAVCNEIEIDKWKSYIKEHNLDWINVADPELKANFRTSFDVQTTPTLYVLDNEKKIIAKKISIDHVAELIDRKMKSN